MLFLHVNVFCSVSTVEVWLIISFEHIIRLDEQFDLITLLVLSFFPFLFGFLLLSV